MLTDFPCNVLQDFSSRCALLPLKECEDSSEKGFTKGGNHLPLNLK